jgi:hypothetical protein
MEPKESPLGEVQTTLASSSDATVRTASSLVITAGGGSPGERSERTSALTWLLNQFRPLKKPAVGVKVSVCRAWSARKVPTTVCATVPCGPPCQRSVGTFTSSGEPCTVCAPDAKEGVQPLKVRLSATHSCT